MKLMEMWPLTKLFTQIVQISFATYAGILTPTGLLSGWGVCGSVLFSGMGRLLGGALESAGVGNLSGTAWLTREREQDDGGNNSGAMLYVELCSSSTDVELSCF